MSAVTAGQSGPDRGDRPGAEATFQSEPPLPVGSKGRLSSGGWGMWTLVATEAALFAYLLFSYFYIASQTVGAWPPSGPPKLGIALPDPFILLAGSQWHRARAGDHVAGRARSAQGPARPAAAGNRCHPGAGRGVFGCASRHAISGIRGARGNVGPPLDHVGSRTFIAGMLRNDPDNLLRWLRHPQSVVPGNAMPDTGLSDAQARDIAAFLYTLH